MSIINGFKTCRKGLHQYPGHLKRCPDCRKISKRALNKKWYQNNKEKKLASHKKWRENNKEKMRALQKEWYKNNKEKSLALDKEWRSKNKHKVNAKAARRRAQKKQAVPLWADTQKIKEMHRKADALTIATGVPHHVDHIYPLQSNYMCGLHVEYNLQIITAEENIKKGNRAWPGQLDCQKNSVYDIFSKELTDLLND